MCVIFVGETVRPSENMIRAGFTCNPKGAGVAWREAGVVKWKKGLNEDEIIELVPKLPLPLVCHFRVDSCGGAYKQLTHPFPIDPDSTNALEGSTKGNVLFHNGHYTSWKMDMKEVAVKGHHPLPAGKYSDSRAMAWIASHIGLGFLELTEEKIVAFGPKTLLFFGGPWMQVNGIICSNRGWEGCFQRMEYPPEKVAEHDRRLLPAVYQNPPVRQHMDSCVCDQCKTSKSTSVEVEVIDTPFRVALREFRLADKALRANKISKNKWKKAKHNFERASWTLQDEIARKEAMDILENPGLLH